MKYIEVAGTDRPEWLLWRHGGIGSSDAGAILGVSRFKTREKLLIEKAYGYAGEDDRNSYIKDRGNKIEASVRTFLEDKYKDKFPPKSVMSEAFPFMRATLDGANEDCQTILEIKLLTRVNPDKVNKETDGYKKWEYTKNGVIPKEYYPQVMHQMMITGAERALFVGYMEVKGEYYVTDSKLAIVEIKKDLTTSMRIDILATEEFQFWYEVQKKKQELKYGGELE